MKKRILTGWTIKRAVYLIFGVLIVVQGFREKEWGWILAGGYFASMGLFSFGCASGNCYVEKERIDSTSSPTIKPGSDKTK